VETVAHGERCGDALFDGHLGDAFDFRPEGRVCACASAGMAVWRFGGWHGVMVHQSAIRCKLRMFGVGALRSSLAGDPAKDFIAAWAGSS
jgi:hypothetical protein